MGAGNCKVMAIPLLGSLAGVAGTLVSSALAGFAFFCTSQAAASFCKSCNCQSSIATRIGYSIIFLLNSMVAWLMLTPWAMHKIESITYDYIKLNCESGKCYGVLAVHRICFALVLFHAILSSLLVGVRDTRTKRAAIQNGWWGPKVASWIILIVISFTIPNGFFMFWSRYIAIFGSAIFIMIGLVLLVDFVHTWSESCLDKWESDPESNFWQWILVGSTLLEYLGVIALTVVDYVFFGHSGCGLNQFFITFNLILCMLATVLSVMPIVQEANPRSGLAQSGMVAIYTTYLVTSAVANHEDKSGQCNPLTKRANAARSSMIILGAVFTFLAIAYSTSRAATQSKAFSGKKGANGGGAIRLPSSAGEEGEMGPVTAQPTKKDSLRIQAMMAAVEAGSLPASALDEISDDEDEDEGAPGASDRDDEKAGTRYNYSWFHVIFCLAAMYVSMLLTDWNVVIPVEGGDQQGDYVRIGRSGVAMWMRIVSSWLSLLLYIWSLLAPVLMPDRFS